MRRGMLGVVFVALCFGGSCDTSVGRSPGSRLARFLGSQDVREALLGELRPVALTNCEIRRFGSPNDGGYLLCDNLLGEVKSAYSYGIDKEDNWGCQVSASLGVTVHQYDCFTPHRPECPGGRVTFHDECIGPRTETTGDGLFDTLTNQIAKNGDGEKRILLKIDVEGAEWEPLFSTPEEVLDRIEQIAIEFHGVDKPHFVEVLRRLKRQFHLVSVHFNNWACDGDVAPMPGWAYQALFVNKRIGVLDPGKPGRVPGSPPDAPDNPRGPDCQPTFNPG